MKPDLQTLTEQARENLDRVAKLGSWPSWINPEQSLLTRIPTAREKAAGLDAGLACALDLIPRDKQRLAAILHAAYTPDAVEQVRTESTDMTPDSETTWWLAISSICVEGKINSFSFYDQLRDVKEIAERPQTRITAARQMLAQMTSRFTLVGGVPFIITDGGLQGAYLSGHAWGVQYAEAYGIFFLGTFLPSLGLESFEFSTEVDSEGRNKSGPVHGSKQFVKISSFPELLRAIEAVKAKLG